MDDDTQADAPTPSEVAVETAGVLAADVVTVEVAMALFAERPDCSAILTDKGWMKRDGSFS